MPQKTTINGVDVIRYSPDEIRGLLTAIATEGRGLTEWEASFTEQMRERDSWSTKQAEIIERIYSERTPL